MWAARRHKPTVLTSFNKKSPPGLLSYGLAGFITFTTIHFLDSGPLDLTFPLTIEHSILQIRPKAGTSSHVCGFVVGSAEDVCAHQAMFITQSENPLISRLLAQPPQIT